MKFVREVFKRLTLFNPIMMEEAVPLHAIMIGSTLVLHKNARGHPDEYAPLPLVKEHH